MKKLSFALSVVLLIIISPNLSHALLVGYTELGGTFYTSLEPTLPSLFLTHLFVEDGSVSSPEYAPFGEVEIGTFNVGQAWLADSSTSDFANSIALLTNGENNIVEYETLQGGGGGSESFRHQGTGFSDPDFQGSTIQSMVLQLDSYSYTYEPAFNWNFDPDDPDIGPAYFKSFSYTVYYYDELTPQHPGLNPVPEPTTLLLFGTGIAGLAAVRRKRK